ncbi:hypothetical protein BN946_scf184644.g10 [Trametes cinnabarina]|uniref:Uncharacterized protein n=1 Tax=Pycnoporus cinnabarinus TaxID=5643 RepID=A0A060SPZ6_PYCCI|nr:hypothetical protein BN946_scf184644.g10 [Trametes cinnabarina]
MHHAPHVDEVFEGMDGGDDQDEEDNEDNEDDEDDEYNEYDKYYEYEGEGAEDLEVRTNGLGPLSDQDDGFVQVQPPLILRTNLIQIIMITCAHPPTMLNTSVALPGPLDPGAVPTSGYKSYGQKLGDNGIVEKLGLSYKNSKELNAIIDQKLPNHRPRFGRLEASIMGKTLDMFSRLILECITTLWSNPEHVRYLCFAPQCHYVDADKTLRLYHDLHTGKWWWSIQRTPEAKNPGATVVLIIIFSDKTQVTLFQNKSAYPVYLTIGNLPKAIHQKPGRQGQILLAYLPTSRLEHITNKAARRRTIANLFHASMSHVLEPLHSAGAEGIVMVSGDGVARRCHPILAAYVGDYLEQCLVTCAYTGDCPICQCPHADLGEFPSPYAPRDFEASRHAAKSVGSPEFVDACNDANIKLVQHPFWEDLPYLDIFQSITVDVLHQVYQGVFKHLVSWLKLACGAAELDARVPARLPPNHGLRIFYKGISNLSRVSGTEHRQISRFLLGAIADIELPGGWQASAQLTRATRALLDFMYMAQYPVHSTKTLEALDSTLAAFHADREILVTLGIRTGFNIPKLHSLAHYVRCIKLFGTTDNYSTETTERLHIDFAKEAYRATNHKDEYPQMTQWLERHKKMMHHSHYVRWRREQRDAPPQPAQISTSQVIRWRPPDLTCTLHVKMTRHPTRKAVPLADIISLFQYGAQFFVPALARFIVAWRHPEFSARLVEYHAADIIVPFKALPVFHRIKFWNESVYGKQTIDSIHIRPSVSDASGDVVINARFGTALICVRNSSPGDTEDNS